MGSTGRVLRLRSDTQLVGRPKSMRLAIHSSTTHKIWPIAVPSRGLATEKQPPAAFSKSNNRKALSKAPSKASPRSTLKTQQHINTRLPSDNKPPSPRHLQLGKTIQTLHTLLPSILNTPLPQSILSPQITLRLFPSTHPHLPTVSGRLTYVAALWTAPVAWGRIPILGDVRLIILSERMHKSGGENGRERLIVRWRTLEGEERRPGEAGVDDKNLFAAIWSKAGQALPLPLGGGSQTQKLDDTSRSSRTSRNNPSPSNPLSASTPEGAFTGLFIFEFDELGRLHTHTIEHAEEGGDWEQNTSRVISVTDWLLGQAWGRREGEAGLVMGFAGDRGLKSRSVVESLAEKSGKEILVSSVRRHST